MVLMLLSMLSGPAAGLMPLAALRYPPSPPLLTAAPACANQALVKASGHLKVQRAPQRLGRPTMMWGSDPNEDSQFSFWGASKVGNPHYVMANQREAFVLIFNPGQPDEGVYTLQGPIDGRMASCVLAFAEPDDAERFANLLSAQGFDQATTHQWQVDTLTAFCDGEGFEVSLVPAGVDITPPAQNSHRDTRDTRDGYNDPERNFPGLDVERPDAFAKERFKLEALLEEDPDNCDIDMGDQDCLGF